LSGRGLTVLFTFKLWFMQTPITLESLVYGLCMGLMLASVILWFNVLGKLSSIAGIIELFSRISPTMGLMLARITVFIPELLAQAKLVNKAQRAFKGAATQLTEPVPVSCVRKRSRKQQLAYAGVLSSHLMEWGMEKSLITAQSMMARGYGSRGRTSFRRRRLSLRDIVPLVVMLLLGAISLGCIIWAGRGFQFYPYLSAVQTWLVYAPFVALVLVPLLVQLRDELTWRWSR